MPKVQSGEIEPGIMWHVCKRVSTQPRLRLLLNITNIYTLLLSIITFVAINNTIWQARWWKIKTEPISDTINKCRHWWSVVILINIVKQSDKYLLIDRTVGCTLALRQLRLWRFWLMWSTEQPTRDVNVKEAKLSANTRTFNIVLSDILPETVCNKFGPLKHG